jgi:hypothetical protein
MKDWKVVADNLKERWRDPVKWIDRLKQRHGLIVKGKRISCPPQSSPQHHDYEHGFPLIRSLRASTQLSTSVLFSFVLSLLIVAGSFAIPQSKTILARSCEAGGTVDKVDKAR